MGRSVSSIREAHAMVGPSEGQLPGRPPERERILSGEGAFPATESLRLLTRRGVIPLGFARNDRTLYLVARERSAQWPVDVLREGRVELLLPEERVRGTPELVTDPADREQILGLFKMKYGEEKFARWYEHPARILRVPLDASPLAPLSPSDRYYGWLTSEFDNVADDYDRHILGNRMNRLLRDRSLALLRTRFSGAQRLLEIGCGSGMETIPLLRAGHRILAVDISERMLAVVRRKAEAEGLGDRLTTRRLPARDLEQLLRDPGEASFDGAYSTYGALNCEPDLSEIPGVLYRLLRPGAPFVAGVYNRWCLFELLGYSLSFQPARALGRRRNPILVGASRFCVDVYAHTPADFRRLFARGFRFEGTAGVPVVLPPSDLTSYAERFSRHFERLSAIDAWLGARWPLRGLGDHFLMTFARL